MNSRVASLTYAVAWLDEGRRVSDDAPAREVSIRGFDCHLSSGMLTAVPGDDYADTDSAKDVLEPGLRAWEAHSEIVEGLPFRFIFSGSSTETVDEHGNPGPNRVAHLMEFGSGVDRLSVVRDSFPLPDEAIGTEGPVTSSLRSRWRSMEAGHEPLTSCAFWLYGRITRAFGAHWKQSAGTLNIDEKVLNRLSEISSVSDPIHGRKVERENRPLTDDELGWLRAAGPVLMRRVMEHEAGVENLPRLTMGDIPGLLN